MGKRKGKGDSLGRIHALECTVLGRDACILRLLNNSYIEVDIQTGQIYSLRQPKKRGQRVLLSGSDSRGHRVYMLYDKETKRDWGIQGHHLVWVAANGPIENPDWMMIDHINRDRKDNRIGNLRLVTAKGNQENKLAVDYLEPDICALTSCGISFDRTTKHQKFHSSKCRIQYWKDQRGIASRKGPLKLLCDKKGVFHFA